MKLFYILLLVSAGVCAAQQPAQKGGQPYYHGDLPAQPASLKCGKYEHVEHWKGSCGHAPKECPTCSACWPIPPDHCAPDLHTVTEKEWHALMERLKKLEKESVKRSDVTMIWSVDGSSATDRKSPPDDPTNPAPNQ